MTIERTAVVIPIVAALDRTWRAPRRQRPSPKTSTVARDPDLPPLPRTRGDCADVPRPCPFVSCKYNLYLDVKPTGSIIFSHPNQEPDEMPRDASCALDVAERDGETLDVIGDMLGVNRERIRQIEEVALRKVRMATLANVALRERGEDLSGLRIRAVGSLPRRLPLAQEVRYSEPHQDEDDESMDVTVTSRSPDMARNAEDVEIAEALRSKAERLEDEAAKLRSLAKRLLERAA